METLNKELISRLRHLSLLILFILILGSQSSLIAQTQKKWQWLNQIGSDSWDIAAGVVCNSKNHLFVAGSFNDTLKCNLKNIKSSGNHDVFIAIFDDSGKIKELSSAGGKGDDHATCICETSGENVIIGGILSDSARFDKLSAPGSGKRLFVAGLDNSGKFIWVNTIKITGDASLYVIGSDLQGNIFVSGDFKGSLEAGSQTVISNGKKDIFIARLGAEGTIEKLFSFGSEEDDSPGSLSVDTSGNVVIAGVFGKYFEIDKLKFTPGPKGTMNNSFIAMVDNDFSFKWVNVLYGADYLNISSLKHDLSGNFYVSGSYSIGFHVADTVLHSIGYTDCYLLRYEKDGKLLWGKSFGSWYYDYATNVNIDNNGGAILTGSLGAPIAIDSILLKPQSDDNGSLIIQFSNKGKATWADCFAGRGRNTCLGSVLDKKGNLYFTGSFQNDFEIGGYSLTSYGDQDIFLAKFHNCPEIRAQIFGEPSFCPGMGTELSVKKTFNSVVWNDTIFNEYNIIANNPGKYWVSMLDKFGCLLSDTISVRQNPLPFFSLGRDTTLSVTDSLLLKAPSNYKEYNWLDNSTQPEYLAKNPNNSAGTFDYWLTASDSLSCSYTDTISITYIKGLKTDDRNVRLIIYPNPASDVFSWYLEAENIDQLITEITDLSGRKLYKEDIKVYSQGEERQISLQNLPSGPYNFQVSDRSSGKIFKNVRVIKK